MIHTNHNFTRVSVWEGLTCSQVKKWFKEVSQTFLTQQKLFYLELSGLRPCLPPQHHHHLTTPGVWKFKLVITWANDFHMKILQCFSRLKKNKKHSRLSPCTAVVLKAGGGPHAFKMMHAAQSKKRRQVRFLSVVEISENTMEIIIPKSTMNALRFLTDREFMLAGKHTVARQHLTKFITRDQ